ncbi:unnamed protein product [Protopolystoma xenopodis]|uniref:Uncharacterized protein n=1 Tax=Protopolystoma xenopodis TaxID=117903 RepID=A0A3S5CFD5_9PLAT|nr:unnamed protein product [Protopolystoma xenopodis]
MFLSSIKGLTVRTQIRHRLYIIHQLIDSPLHPRFRNRLLDIAAHLERGNVTLPILEALPRAVGVENTKATEITLEKVEVRVDTLKEGLYAAYLADLLVR